MTVRLLDLGYASYLRSQTVYHAVAECTDETSPGTVILVSPETPYVCIGFHQDLEKEIDTEFCRSRDLPTLRREVGGGAVLLDRDQLFFQFVFPRERTPARIDHLYKYYLTPAVETYRRLGVEAEYRPVNDIQVGSRKICGAGAGRIGGANVVVGNIIFDFDHLTMSRVLRAPSDEFRNQVYKSMRKYVSCLRMELGYVPEREEVKEILIGQSEECLGIKLAESSLTDEEGQTATEIEKRFTDPGWLLDKGRKTNDWVKITSDVKVLERTHSANGGQMKAVIRLYGDLIDDIKISGDFEARPWDKIRSLEAALIGRPWEAGAVRETVESFYKADRIESGGVGPGDFVSVIVGNGRKL